jgi:uncharacterized damage-inducible protein DinB/predicted enzyme related to lactoylglutathione lyase
MGDTGAGELRVSLTAADFDTLRRFYRDVVGLEEAKAWEEHGNGVIFDVGRATLELLDEQHTAHVDEIETGQRTGDRIRLAIQVPDTAEAAARLTRGGADVGEPRMTPWGDLNARVRPPEGPQLTLFASPEDSTSDAKAHLHRYLRSAREAVLWKLEGLSEYGVRRPLVPADTNLLGLVKHLARVEVGYFGETFGRPSDVPLPWFEEDAEPNADMWATAQETRGEIVDLYHRAWQHADATIEALQLDSKGQVAWWPAERREVTLHQILVHVIAETNRHGGHADIVRELVDGAAGLRADNDNLPPADAAWWAGYRERVEAAAREAGERND